MRKLFLASFLTAVAVAGSVFAIACGSSDASDSANPINQDGSVGETGPTSDAGVFFDASGPIEANGIVLVHAAAFPAFRICFEGTPDDQPQPSTEVMPDSNLVGIDVGTAVRLPPTSATLGKARVYPELLIRGGYPPFGGKGPKCNELAQSDSLEVGEVTENLGQGVHVLALVGCRGSALDPIASVARCGADWDAVKGTDRGNLKIQVIELQAFGRPGAAKLSVQLLQLSPALQQRAVGRALGLAYGSLDAGVPSSTLIEGMLPFGVPGPVPPAVLDYSAAEMESYSTNGVFVTLGDAIGDGGVPVEAGADAGPREVVLAQSLAEIQKRSSSRALPRDWFSTASSYVVLSVGDPDPRLDDGGPNDDVRPRLHLLALPLAAPDAGSSGPPPDDDGGT